MAKGGRKKRESAEPGGKDDRLALALAEGMTRSEAALYAGMGERTVYTKLQDPAFKALVVRVRDRLINEAVGKLAAGATAAAAELRDLLRSDDEGIRLQAGKALLDRLVKLHGHYDLAERIETLESRMKPPTSAPPRPRLDIPGADARWTSTEDGSS